jgi:hypothetical protein
MRSKISTAIHLIAISAISTRAGDVFAHEGHGLTGAHWHATDVWGFVVVGGLCAAAVWFSRRGK